MFALVACSSDNKPAIDAAPPPIDTPVAVAPTCMAYCTNIQANCTGTNAQYPSMDQCMGTCAAFTVGTMADTTGNTLGCRLYHSGGPSMTTPTTHCFHAGPGGASADGVTSQCGADCDGFCSIVMKDCVGKYADLAACQAACTGFTSTPPFTDTSTGNTRQCRLYHATNAAAIGQQNVAAHCGHATNAANAPPCMN
jgi:hypothetical protein